MNDDESRAEQALRDALKEHAEDVSAEELGPLPHRRRPSGLRWLGVAAAVAVALGAGTIVVQQVGTGARPANTSAASTAPNNPASTSPSDAPVISGLPGPPAGFQWVSSRDVAIQVPVQWAFGRAPTSDWCAATGSTPGATRPPYYDSYTGMRAVLAIGCPGPLPQDRDVLHLQLDAAMAGDGFGELPAWYRTRQVGNVRVAVAVPSGSAEDEALAQTILGSARTFTTDQAGCTPNSPIERWAWARPTSVFDVTDVTAVTAVSLCQSEKSETEVEDGRTGPRLVASRLLAGEAAQQLLTAVQQAPAGSGPNDPASCLESHHSASAFVLRLHAAGTTRDLFAHVGNCRNNAVDDGTTPRAVTKAWCAVLREPPLAIDSMSGVVGDVCLDNPSPKTDPPATSTPSR